ncbi:cell division protein FtsL [Psychrobacter sp. T6-1]|uniref:cell division protein FtsL n=1 Tax=Psychrobacter sp. T6-1 TaxID=3457447 RepID=UPI003FD0F32F
MAPSGKPTKQQHTSTTHTDVGELFAKRFNVVSIYVVILLLLAGSIIWSGIKTAQNVQQYHQDYKTLQDMKKQERKLQIEHQRLLIEQQTFSATPQIASRAVAELGMYSPTLKDKLIIQPGVAAVLSSAAPNPQKPLAEKNTVAEQESLSDTLLENAPQASTDVSEAAL